MKGCQVLRGHLETKFKNGSGHKINPKIMIWVIIGPSGEVIMNRIIFTRKEYIAVSLLNKENIFLTN